MDFRLSPEQEALRESARRFAREQMTQVALELEATNEPLSAAWRRRYAEMGFLAVNLPEAYGGLGLGHLDALLVLEEFAKVSPAVAFRPTGFTLMPTTSSRPKKRCQAESTSLPAMSRHMPTRIMSRTVSAFTS